MPLSLFQFSFRAGRRRSARPSVVARSFGTFMLMAAVGLANAHEGPHAPSADTAHEPVARVLGEIDFPTRSKVPQAQQAFIRGMLLLHLFEYPFAREEFLRAQDLEPDFAMAYWGEAMTHNHPLWDEQDREAGRAALMKLGATAEQRLATTQDPRERGLLASLDILYGDGPKAARDRAYMRTLEQMAATWPDDHEIQLFYALSLLGVQAGVRDVPTYMLSTAISQSVFCANPRHPGAAHYLIHGVDDPEHAALGLAAARALAVMAPDAGHSLHMTSHIFTALGMWDDVVEANENAARVQNAMREESGQSGRRWGHYHFWLLYGYLQQGRLEDARSLLTAAYQELQEADETPRDRLLLTPDRSHAGSVVQMWLRYLVETGDWTGDIAAWTFKLGEAFDPNLNVTWANGFRAAYGGQAARVRTYAEQFSNLKRELEREIRNQDEPQPTELLYLDRLAVMERQLHAAVEIARGETGEAARIAAAASQLEGEMPFAYGPPFVDWPAAELQGQLLLEAGRYADAAAAFETQLQRARLRSASLLGLSRALRKLGRDAEADYWLATLNRNWLEADPSVRRSAPDLPKPPARKSAKSATGPVSD
ncbi:hypothetical protein [Elongatibacter sediminis]